jgi:hypothetical protein
LDPSGSNNKITLIAKNPGTGGNSISAALSAPTANTYPGRVVTGGITAKATINPTGSNNNITVIALAAGTAGNSITVTLANGGANQTLSVDVAGSAITVNLATDGSSVATSTAAQVAAAINADVEANLLVEAYAAEATTSGVTAAVSATSLTGGVSDANAFEYILATNSSVAVTSTAAAVVTALSGNATVAALVDVYGGEATISGTLAAVSQTSLSGGTTDAGEVEVLLATDASLAITTTAGEVIGLLGGMTKPITLTGASVEGDGTGVVTALSRTPLAHGARGNGDTYLKQLFTELVTIFTNGSSSESKPNQKGMQPMRQRSLLLNRLGQEKEILDSFSNQEVQQASGSVTTN